VELIAFSDANGYLAAAYDQAKDGVWKHHRSAAAARSCFSICSLFLEGFPYRTCCCSKLFLSAATVLQRRPLRNGEIMGGRRLFCAHQHLYPNLCPTALTEPLGFFWALLSVPFIISAVRTGSLAHALLGFGGNRCCSHDPHGQHVHHTGSLVVDRLVLG